jgi:hypothetical protein
MKLSVAALVSTIALPSMVLAAGPLPPAMSGSTEWVLFYDSLSVKNALGSAMQAKQIIEKAGGEIRCAFGKCL